MGANGITPRYCVAVGSLFQFFFVILQMEEMTVLNHILHDVCVHLSQSDNAVDNPAAPAVLRVAIKHSRWVHFKRGEPASGEDVNRLVSSRSTVKLPVSESVMDRL